MKLMIGSDHGGFSLKQEIMAHLEERGESFRDFGITVTICLSTHCEIHTNFCAFTHKVFA